MVVVGSDSCALDLGDLLLLLVVAMAVVEGRARLALAALAAAAAPSQVWVVGVQCQICLLYTSPSPRDATLSRMPSSA